MLSAHTKEGAEITFQALAMGAADFLTKPSGTVSIDLYDLRYVLIDKLYAIAHSNLEMLKRKLMNVRVAKPKRGSGFCVAVGTSTGGVRALHEIIPAFPVGSGLKGIIAIHIPRGFTQSLAERLNNLSQMVVKEAKKGDIIVADQFFIGPGGEHTVVVSEGGQDKIDFACRPSQYGLKPSADFLLESVAMVFGAKAIGVILTGMGHDGAKGIEAIKDKGGIAIAEDPKTAVVSGMPRTAIKTGKVDFILKLSEIPRKIMELNASG